MEVFDLRIDLFREEVDFTAVGFRFGWRNEMEGERGWLNLAERCLLAGKKYGKFREFLEREGVFLRNVDSSEEFFFTMVSRKENTERALSELLSLMENFQPDITLLELAKTHQLALVEASQNLEPWREVYEWMFNYAFQWDFREKLGVKEDIEEVEPVALGDFFEKVLSSPLLFYTTSEVPPPPCGGSSLPPVRRVKWKEREKRVVGRSGFKEVYRGYFFEEWSPELELVAMALGSPGLSHIERTMRDLLLSWDAEVSCRSDGALLLLYLAYPPSQEDEVGERLERSLSSFSPREELDKLVAWSKTEFLSLVACGEDGLMRFVLRFGTTGEEPRTLWEKLSHPSELKMEKLSERLLSPPDFAGEVSPL